MSLLSVEGLTTEFRAGGAWVPAIRSVGFSLARGEILALVGESGCGKSTVANSLLRLLPGNARIAAGAVSFGGEDLMRVDEARLRELRGARIGAIFQDPMTALDPACRIGRQITETLTAHLRIGRAEAEARALSLLRSVGIPAPEERLRAYPHQLSGGMRQRVALAIALSCGPELLVADEPTTALDVTIQAQILQLVRSLMVAERGAGVLLITHDLGVVAQVCDRVAIMYAGEIVETGPVGAVFAGPLHPYTRALLGALPSEAAPRGALRTIEGRVPDPAARPSGCSFAPRCPQARAACAAPGAPPRARPAPEREVACVLHV